MAIGRSSIAPRTFSFIPKGSSIGYSLVGSDIARNSYPYPPGTLGAYWAFPPVPDILLCPMNIIRSTITLPSSVRNTLSSSLCTSSTSSSLGASSTGIDEYDIASSVSTLSIVLSSPVSLSSIPFPESDALSGSSATIILFSCVSAAGSFTLVSRFFAASQP